MEPVYKQKTVTNRDLIELAVRAGRHFQSENTGFVHLDDQIPVYENALFALALLRSRTVENAQEAMQLLDKLLHFQNQQVNQNEGGFPRFLHEYPRCEHTFLGALLLPVFYLVLRQFHSVLGEVLRTRLEDAIDDLIINQTHWLYEQQPPAHLRARLGAAFSAYGTYKQNAELVSQGNSFISYPTLHSPSQLGDLLLVAQLSGTAPPAEFIDHLVATYHTHTASYAGPAAQEFHRAGEPEVTLYDFMMANLTGTLPARAQRPRHIQLQAALVLPTELQLPLAPQTRWAFGVLDRDDSFNWALSPGMAPMRLAWGNGDRVRSLVLQGGMTTVRSRAGHDHVHMEIDLPDSCDAEDRNRCREVAFYMDCVGTPELTLDGQRTNTFKAGEKVFFGDADLRLEMCVEKEEGGGEFLCHLQRANRPSEREPANPGHDWALYVRTLRRDGPSSLRVSLRVHEPAPAQ